MNTMPYRLAVKISGIIVPVLVAASVASHFQKAKPAARGAVVAPAAAARARHSRPSVHQLHGRAGASTRPHSGRQSEAQHPAAMHGTLVIAGGGDSPDEVYSAFVNAAGGTNARLVIVPTASELAGTPELDEDINYWRKQHVASCIVLHTTQREVANDPEFCSALENATGVWFMGGSQTRLAEVYLNTRFLRLVKAVLERDGAVGGESAGAAIMSKVMICNGFEAPQTGRGFGLLPGTLIDQHFLTRHRDGRMRRVLHSQQGLVGLGIDEETAIIVHNGEFTVTGNSKVVVYFSQPGGEVSVACTLGAGSNGNLAALTAATHAHPQLADGAL